MSSPQAPDIESVVNRAGRRIYFNPHDARGVSLKASAGDVNGSSLVMWNQALAVHDWNVVVDVGCNYGEMIAGGNIPANARIIAFEPGSGVLPYLERTLAEYPRDVELVRSAVSDQIITGAQFARDATWSGKSSLLTDDRDDTAGDEIVYDSVDVTTLDTVLGTKTGTACIKVDVEGNEDAVLRGATKALAAMTQWAMLIEIAHMSIERVGELVDQYHFYLLDMNTNQLVRILSTNPTVLDELLKSGWIYPQDALLLSKPLSSGLSNIDELTVLLNRAVTTRELRFDAIYGSRSWRLVNPLRAVARLGRGVVGRFGNR